MQMICALLIFETSALSRPLPDLSPWLDWLVLPQHELFADLKARQHRRFIKTHTPLDGLPNDERVTFIVVGRHPLDAAVSLYHQSQNIDRERIAELTGKPDLAQVERLQPLDEWLQQWIESDVPAQSELDSFNGVFHHLTDAWNRRDQGNVMLVHYADLLHDLPGEMRRIAVGLDLGVPSLLIDELAAAATFQSMQAHSSDLAPDPAGVLKERTRFFRAGQSGAGAAALDSAGLAAYNARAAQAATSDMLAWLHR